jgi:hypothetical protein
MVEGPSILALPVRQFENRKHRTCGFDRMPLIYHVAPSSANAVPVPKRSASHLVGTWA